MVKRVFISSSFILSKKIHFIWNMHFHVIALLLFCDTLVSYFWKEHLCFPFWRYSIWWFLLSSAAAAAKLLQLCPTLCDPKDGIPPGSPIPECPEKKTGVGCHFLPQHMKVKSESEVVQSCPTLRDPMDCSPPGSIHGIFQERELEWGAIAFSVSSLRST